MRAKLRGVGPIATVAAAEGDTLAGGGLVAALTAAAGDASGLADGGPPEHAATSSALKASPRVMVTSSCRG
jgi:hypothetical protein